MLKGKIINKQDSTPIPFASVKLINQNEGTLSDGSGNFLIYISNIKKEDTVFISSVGYDTLIIPLSKAITASEFVLIKNIKTLETVIVKSFSNYQTFGSNKVTAAFFRSWNVNNTGGEIGLIFNFPYSEYTIDKIRFKVNNGCDSCNIRLHIRNIINGKPAEDLLSDTIIAVVKSIHMDDKIPEFDLTAFNFIYYNLPKIFISLEVLNCKSEIGNQCSFSFVGTEKGKYTFKSKNSADWETIEDYSIYMRLITRY
jgi:hypothetical protein